MDNKSGFVNQERMEFELFHVKRRITAASHWKKNGTDIYYKEGNVGIGLINPAYDLDVTGNINYTDTIYYGGNAFIQQPADRNLFIGVGILGAGLNALYSLTIGDKNVGIGVHALYALTTDSRNTCVGYYAGALFATFGENSCFGAYAGARATKESGTYLGYQAGYTSGRTLSGVGNTYVGRQAGAGTTTGYNNSCFGFLAGSGITEGLQNVCIGRTSGSNLTTGDENTFLGHGAGAFPGQGNINYSIALGTNAQCTASNQMVIGATGRAITNIYVSEGVTNASPVAFTLQTTGATGSNGPGANFNLAGGKATGNAASGEVVFKTSTVGSSGSTLQSLAEIARVGTDGIYIKNQKELRFYDNGNYVGFKAPGLGADKIWVLPATDGSNLHFLQTDGSGNLTFASGISGIGANEINDTHIDWGLSATQVNADDMPYTSGETVHKMFDESLNSGLMHDCIIVDAGTLDITWPATQIFDASVDSEVDINSGSGTCTDNLTNYLIWTSGSTLTLGTTPPDDSANEIGIAHIVCMGNDIWAIHQEDRIYVREYEISAAMGQMFPAIVTNGLIVSEDTDGTNAFDLTISTGVYYVNGHLRKSVTGFNSRATNLVRWYHSSGVWTSDTNHSISNTQWDDPAKVGGQGLETVSASKYYAHVIFLVESTIHVVYPDAEYNTIAQAVEGGGGNKPPGFLDEPLLMCIVMKGNDAALPTAGGERWIDLRPLTTGSVNAGIVTDHGNLSGLTDIADHPGYVTHSLATAANDFLVASGSGVIIKKTLAETGAILEADIQHDNIQGVTANQHIDWTSTASNFNTSGTINGGTNLYLGTDDIQFGRIYLYGHATGSPIGGEVQFYTAADHDSSVENYYISVYTDAFYISRMGHNDIILDSSGNVTLFGTISAASGSTITGTLSSGNIIMTAAAPAIFSNTSDGSDNKRLLLGGGGGAFQNRGANIECRGNEYATGAGELRFQAGNAASGTIGFYTEAANLKLLIAKTGAATFSSSVRANGGFSDGANVGIDATFINGDGATVTVSGGIITSIV